MFKTLSIIVAAAMLLTAALAAPALAGGGGEGPSFNAHHKAQHKKEREVMKKMARDLEVAGTPGRVRAKMISTVGAAGGAVVGDISATIVTCVFRCFGVDTGYKPGDISKQSWKAVKEMWGFRTKPLIGGRFTSKLSPADRKALLKRFDNLKKRSGEPSLGITGHMGYQADIR